MAEATAAKRTAPTSPKASRSEAKKASPKAQKAPTSDKSQFAVFATGGKQYRVKAGDKLKIEKLPGDHKVGDILSFPSVLLIDNGASEISLGLPFIKDAEVSATLKKIARYKTVDVIKYKQKSRYFKKYGHRQPYYEVEITGIK